MGGAPLTKPWASLWSFLPGEPFHSGTVLSLCWPHFRDASPTRLILTSNWPLLF